MGKARDGRISKDFGDGKTKIKVRFANEKQQIRVAILMKYLQCAYEQGVPEAEVESLLPDDFGKCLEIIKKIEERHSEVRDAPVDR